MTNTSTAPRTRTAAAAIAAEAPAPMFTLAECVASVDIAGGAADAAAASLASVTLARFKFHAERYALTRDVATDTGDTVTRSILPDGLAAKVREALWLEATGTAEAPAAKGRTKGERALGQYMSKFSRVAESVDYGTDALTDDAPDTPGWRAADKALAAESKGAREAKSADTAAGIDRADTLAFVAWRASLNAAERKALATVTDMFSTGTGAAHLPAFVASLGVTVK